MSIRVGDKFYIAPSGVQKERIKFDEIFVLDESQNIIEHPRAVNNKLKISECTPLFFNAYNMRNAGACLHSHSQNCVLITLLCDK